jgi:predicted DNA-binding protein (MmcQ/YjbR family)
MDRTDDLFGALVLRCATRPRAVRRRRWGETMYTSGRRVFAFLGPPHAPSVTVKVAPERRDQVFGHPAVYRARFVGHFGWLTVHVRDTDSLRVALDLIDHSYELIVSGQRR